MPIKILPRSPEELKAMLREVVAAHNRIAARRRGGKTAGELTKRLGLGIFSEANIRNQKENARIGGKVTAAIPGHTAKAGSIGGKVTAAIPGALSKAGAIGGKIGGKIGGRKTADLQIGIHSAEVREIATSMGGLVQGPANVVSGHLDRIRTREVCSLGGKTNAHRNYHVARNRFNPKCDFCTGVLEDRNA